MLVIVGGPAGSGKSTAGNLLAEELKTPFIEGDSLHPQANIDKMSNGIPLNDEDRWGWLKAVAVAGAVEAKSSKTGICVATCSSLKKIYREFMRQQVPDETVVFVFLAVERDELFDRVAKRKNHFMKSDMVQSQLDIMEVPEPNEVNSLVYWNNVDITDCAAKIRVINEKKA